MSFRVHADVLKMARTEDKRERIKWYHARRVFFELASVGVADDGLRIQAMTPRTMNEGLKLARQCKHEDARFLVSLFPNGSPATEADVAALFLAHGDDARCLCWAAESGAEPLFDLFRQAAESGCAFAKAQCGMLSREAHAWLEEAAAQGEPQAMAELGCILSYGRNEMPTDSNRGRMLLREAAELGDPRGQFEFASIHCNVDAREQFKWFRRAALQECEDHRPAQWRLMEVADAHVRLLSTVHSGRCVFEIGAVFSTVKLDPESSERERNGCRLAVEWYERWCEEARRGVLCWIWAARKLGVVKDIRLLIADLVWEDKVAWSDRVSGDGAQEKQTVKKKTR